ncbi:MAG: DinB family protein [Planctomycetota bacterium]
MAQVLTKWIHRRWTFDGPAELHPVVIERLRGTPARVRAMAKDTSPERAARAPEQGWSIQRHLGHLGDLDALLNARLDAYERGEPVLPAADMQNEASVQADHDAGSLDDIVRRFEAVRRTTVARLDAYPRDFFARSAWHDRLGVHKRVVDTCRFFADHDDHHLALARSLISG